MATDSNREALEKFHASRPGPLGWLMFAVLFFVLLVVDNWSLFKGWFQ